MYTLAVEMHGLRQLKRLQPDLVQDIRRRVIAVVEVHGGTFSAEHGGLWVFRFERAQPGDRQGVLDALNQTASVLAARENELAGWGVLVDYLEGPVARTVSNVRETVLGLYEDNAVWLGPGAYPLLSSHLATDHLEICGRSLYRVLGILGPSSADVGSAYETARSDRSTDAILDALAMDELVGGMLLVVSDDPTANRVNVRSALAELIGSSPVVRWLEAERCEGDPLGPVISAFTALDVHETTFWLREAERAVWDERVSLVDEVICGGTRSALADCRDTDLLIAFEVYLAAYVRRAADALIPPFLVCHEIDRWSSPSVDALARIAGRLPVRGGEPGLTLVGTSSRAVSTAAISSMVRHTLRLPRRGITEIREHSGAPVNWDRLARVTHLRSAAVVHYLAQADYWDGLTDDRLDGVTDSDLAWKVVAAEDSEFQELMLAAHYTGSMIGHDQFVEVAVKLGPDRTRVPALLSRMRSLGLVEDREVLVLCYPEHRSRLEATLGRTAHTVYTKIAGALVDLVAADEIVVTEPLVRFLTQLDEGRHVPRLFHSLLTRVMSERRLDEAHRLLYDAATPRCPSSSVRACLQGVLIANRLRHSLLQGNTQAAERAAIASDRINDEAVCAEISADLLVQKARHSFIAGRLKETVAFLKQATMLHQDLDDGAGLARANLDFGSVLLAQEDLLGAKEYVLIGAQEAADSGDSFEQIRAVYLMLVTDFVFGNFTRVLSTAVSLADRARDLGMREMQLFAQFAQGRVAFELGRYDEAIDCFSRGRARTRLYGMPQPGIVLERWLARALLYDGRVNRGMELLQDRAQNAEAALFLAEGFLLLGEHVDGINELERGLAFSRPVPATAEGLSWANGFASLEDRAIGRTTGIPVLDHQMMALRGFLLAENGRVAEGVNEMHRLTRELGISEIDPYNRIYFYLYSMILPDSGEFNVEDGTTVLGKAVRYIQQRTSRMDAYNHKTDFLRRNYWNTRLMHHAQAHNLV